MYGVSASKNGQIMVEPRRTGEGGRTEQALASFVQRRGTGWTPGRLSLTRLHLAYIPGAGARGAPPLNLDLRDIEGVEISGGRVTKIVTIRLATHTLHAKISGAQVFAQAVATAAEEARMIRRTSGLR